MQDSHFEQRLFLFSHLAPKYGCRGVKAESPFVLSFTMIHFAPDMQITVVSSGTDQNTEKGERDVRDQ